jgi:hypothetical protein
MRRLKIKHFIYGLILIWVLIDLVNPLQKSEKYIREDLLKLTPLGTDMNEVIAAIKAKEKWKIRYIRDYVGYDISSNGRPSEAGNVYLKTIVGKKSIRVFLGKYGLIFETGVSAYYGFDDMDALIDISIRKDTDTL